MKRNKPLIKILNFLLVIVMIILSFLVYQEIKIILKKEIVATESINKDQDIINEYGKIFKEKVKEYKTINNTLPKYKDIKNNIIYGNYNVYCNINEIYSEDKIYLSMCYIDNNYTTAFYGKREKSIDENGLLKNEYFIDYDYLYVKNTNDFKAKSDKDVDNIIYTIVNSGIDKFSFKCSYDNCIKHVNEIMDTKYSLAYINSFVHPFNSYKTITINHNSISNVTIEVEKKYKQDEINTTDKLIDEIIKNNIKDNMTTKEKIRTLHDYIINNSSYATDDIVAKYENETFNTAYSILTTGYGRCNAYSDFISIALNKLNIPNYQIPSKTHVWNLVYLDKEWLHLDATWDDPVTSNNENILDYTYFLITDEKLSSLNIAEHEYDKNIYLELK